MDTPFFGITHTMHAPKKRKSSFSKRIRSFTQWLRYFTGGYAVFRLSFVFLERIVVMITQDTMYLLIVFLLPVFWVSGINVTGVSGIVVTSTSVPSQDSPGY